ncbi:hypothetical protein [Pseudonocardia sp. TRM90224]|nr:hypothetical protein [Pseudonocardia sp. TRM90224]
MRTVLDLQSDTRLAANGSDMLSAFSLSFCGSTASLVLCHADEKE